MMNEKPMLSIIVPVYKVEQELPKCVESLRTQTMKNIEIILVDDGSPDGCPELCDSYASMDDRITVIHKKNGGLSDARNAGIKAAKADYVLLVDSDDYIEADTCERFAAFFDTKADIIIGLLRNEDGTLYSKKSPAEVGKVYRGEDYFVNFRPSIIACSVASAYRKQYLLEQDILFLVGRYHEDNDFTPRAYIKAERVVYSDITFYVRCVREDSITQHKDKRKNLEDLLYIGGRLENYASTLSNERTQKTLRRNACNSYLYMFRMANIYQYPDLDYAKYVDKKFVMRNSTSFKNKAKAALFCVSPRLYVKVANKLWE